MLLFRPVALDTQLLKRMVPAGGAGYVDFCMVKDPLVSLKRGKPVGQDALVSLLNNEAGSAVSSNGNGHKDSGRVSPHQNEWWN